MGFFVRSQSGFGWRGTLCSSFRWERGVRRRRGISDLSACDGQEASAECDRKSEDALFAGQLELHTLLFFIVRGLGFPCGGLVQFGGFFAGEFAGNDERF